MAAAAGLFLAGCDEHVQIIRDPDIDREAHTGMEAHGSAE
jgi:hypothetical protein